MGALAIVAVESVTPMDPDTNDDDEDESVDENDGLDLMYDGPATTGTHKSAKNLSVESMDALYAKNTNNGTRKGANKKLSVDSLYSKNSSNNSSKGSIDT